MASTGVVLPFPIVTTAPPIAYIKIFPMKFAYFNGDRSNGVTRFHVYAHSYIGIQKRRYMFYVG